MGKATTTKTETRSRPKTETKSKPKEEAKEKKPPSKYNLFVKKELPKLKAENPGLDHKDAFKLVAKKWADSLSFNEVKSSEAYELTLVDQNVFNVDHDVTLVQGISGFRQNVQEYINKRLGINDKSRSFYYSEIVGRSLILFLVSVANLIEINFSQLKQTTILNSLYGRLKESYSFIIQTQVITKNWNSVILMPAELTVNTVNTVNTIKRLAPD
ncbi:9776_t:CDS:2 [Scutellospora calospora]|uniref:9776_t:CDS:1 n=1 Tax=Scutellospora calospora TaxID=85575 RepID=A0ACA9LTF5_9GLOM|nr:9776_t:CDS:2 [Scutellospora calospora]